jgi:hypothetical protein
MQTLKGWKLEIHERECHCCKICGGIYRLTVHHKLPKARGGRSDKDNCVCWCATCHREFHNRWGLTTSDDYGNPVGDYKGTNRPQKRKQRKHCRKHRKNRR